MTITIQKLFDHVENIPKIPEVVRTLIKQVNDPNVDFSLIAENVEKEQVISVKILRLVNSAHYGVPKQVGSIQQAIVILGLTELKKLIITSGVISAISDVPGLNIDDFWLDNYRTASYAEFIAKQSNIKDSDLIFTAGLLNNLGTILIHLGESDIAKQVQLDVRRGQDRVSVEQKHLGYTSQQVTAELCKQWQFSDELIETIINSSEPLSSDEISLGSCAISVARFISQSTYSEKTEEEILAEFPRKEWQQLGLKETEIEEKMALMLELDTGIEGLLD